MSYVKIEFDKNVRMLNENKFFIKVIRKIGRG